VKPNLFIVGAPKCGTTAWYEYLRGHPDIFLPDRKEPHYFCTDFPDQRRIRTERDYLGLFAAATSQAIIGEASASYLYSKEAARNLREFAPDAKIIIFVRNRADLLFSWHNQLLDNGVENRTNFEEAWQLSGKRAAGDHGPACDEKSFLDYRAFGFLGEQVERYFRQFPADRIRVFGFDDWRRDPRATYCGIMRFLGLRDDGRKDFPPINQAQRSRSRLLRLLLHRPPRRLSALYRAIRRLTGLDAAPFASLVARLNAERGYGERLSPSLRAEIDRLYAADEAKLQSRVWRAVK
jgi:hypothetical protein